MTYEWLPLTLRNTKRIATNSSPLIVELGAITGNDASFIRVAAVVGSFVGVGAATLTLEHSHDGGSTWVAVANTVADSITATGTFRIETTAASGVLSPSVRVILTPDAGVAVGLLALRKTFSSGPIIPTAATGGATETTAQDILEAVDGVETLLTSIAAEDFATEATLATIKLDTASLTTALDVSASTRASEATLQTVGGNILSALAAPVAVSRSVAHAPYTRNYASSNLPASPAWTQIVASTTAKATKLEIFDSSGEFLELAIGGAGAEVTQFVVTPGGNGQLEYLIPAGSRVSIRPLGAVALTVGNLAINFYS